MEGNSVRAASRMTGAAKGTVLSLAVRLGEACADYQDAVLRNLPCKRLQADEIWSFLYAKQRNVERAKSVPTGAGDVWTWTAICRDTKLVPAWLVGKRDPEHAMAFMTDLARRMAGRVQITTDGLAMYLDAVPWGFGENVDFAQLVKQYGSPSIEEQRRYSPARCIGAKRAIVMGAPNPDEISTSHVERQNLTMRMSSRRFTRLTNAFSKKFTNHEAAVALHFLHYNFARPHSSLKGATPAQAVGVSRYRWSVDEIIGLLDAGNVPAA